MNSSNSPRRNAARSRKPESARRRGAAANPPDRERAVADFAAAAKIYQRGDWAKARDHFSAILDRHQAEKEICDRARIYLKVCERSLRPQRPSLRDADDFYHHGVYLLNQEDVEEALRTFERAIALDPGNEKALYAKACALARSGRADEAIEALRQSIGANASNRVLAANDSDFDSLRQDSRFIAILTGSEEAAE